MEKRGFPWVLVLTTATFGVAITAARTPAGESKPQTDAMAVVRTDESAPLVNAERRADTRQSSAPHSGNR